jgi:uncharacterized protein YndB with AHSA1/START domain
LILASSKEVPVKTSLIVLGSFVALIVIALGTMALLGSRMSPEHTATRSMYYEQSPAEVYAAVRDFESSPKWRNDVKRVEMLGMTSGHVRFREHAGTGAVTYDVVEDVPGRKLVTRIADRNLGYSGAWTYQIMPDGNGTMLTIIENGEVSNPLFRFLSRHVFGHTGTMEKYLEALKGHLGR